MGLLGKKKLKRIFWLVISLSIHGDRVLRVLDAENRWLTFDELYSMAQCNCDWTDFALQLEQLVEQGEVQYVLPCGADIGYYGIDKL